MNFIDILREGGVVVEILLALFIIGISTMLWKFITYILLMKDDTKLLNSYNEALYNKKNSVNAEFILDSIFSQLELGLTTLKVIATTSPLLGLLGTVIGIYLSFDSIATHGLGDNAYFAQGISMALITTIVGLVVAIPHYIGYNYLVGMLDKIELNFRGKIKKDA